MRNSFKCNAMLAGELINEKDRCKTCKGKKVTQESKSIEIHVNPGMRQGQKITLHGQGDQMVSSATVLSYWQYVALVVALWCPVSSSVSVTTLR